jgi:S-adenosylmethionine/arginine decarboxylase-like enzyme
LPANLGVSAIHKVKGGVLRKWGKHLIVDMSYGKKERVSSADHIRRFAEILVEAIGVKACGPPVLQHVAAHMPDAAGYSLVQLIETSTISGRFCDRSGDAYIDIVSCSDFDSERALDVIKNVFEPEHMRYMTLVRQAPRVRPLAAE